MVRRFKCACSSVQKKQSRVEAGSLQRGVGAECSVGVGNLAVEMRGNGADLTSRFSIVQTPKVILFLIPQTSLRPTLIPGMQSEKLKYETPYISKEH